MSIANAAFKLMGSILIFISAKQDRHCMYNIKVHSCNHCSECVFLALSNQHAMPKCHIVIYGLLVSKLLFHIIP